MFNFLVVGGDVRNRKLGRIRLAPLKKPKKNKTYG
jgi:hypothetical protein